METKIPQGEHWAIITEDRITIPGDERSRQAPGHGYPEHTALAITYELCADQSEFQAKMEHYGRQPHIAGRFRGIHVTETFSVIPKMIVDIVKT